MKKIFLLMIIPAAVMLQSCNKGCTDADAVNFDESASNDDGNCSYEGTITLWFNQSQSIAWDQGGVTSLNVYVGEVLVGNFPVGTYWVTAPDCGITTNITVTKNMGTDKTKSISWEFKDQNDTSLKTGTWNATGGGCDVIQVQ